jgi:hypothetical protein
VGSGKTSLLNAIIGDMIAIPESSIVKMGGHDAKLSLEDAKNMQHELLNPNTDRPVAEPLIKISGSVSYVE